MVKLCKQLSVLTSFIKPFIPPLSIFTHLQISLSNLNSFFFFDFYPDKFKCNFFNDEESFPKAWLIQNNPSLSTLPYLEVNLLINSIQIITQKSLELIPEVSQVPSKFGLKSESLESKASDNFIFQINPVALSHFLTEKGSGIAQLARGASQFLHIKIWILHHWYHSSYFKGLYFFHQSSFLPIHI